MPNRFRSIENLIFHVTQEIFQDYVQGKAYGEDIYNGANAIVKRHLKSRVQRVAEDNGVANWLTERLSIGVSRLDSAAIAASSLEV